MEPLIFEYTNSRDETKTHQLTNWVEEGFYLCGVSGETYKTFRKDRVTQYLQGGAQVKEPDTPPPPNIKTHSPKTPDDRLSVLFTGFASVQRQGLECLAEESGLRLSAARKVTKSLDFLVCGPKAGPKKLQQARLQSTYIMNQAQFLQLLETGELPEDPDQII